MYPFKNNSLLRDKMKYLLVIMISLFSLPITAEQYTTQGIEVIGKGSVSAKPDKFTFTVTVSQRGNVASKAKALIDHKSQLVTQMYLSMGIAESAIESARLELIPRYEKRADVPAIIVHQRLSNQGGENNNTKAVIHHNQLADNSVAQQEKIYFEVSRTIKVTFTNFSRYDQLLDNVVKIGVNRISALKTSIVNADVLYQQALINALKNAHQKATTIAKQMGVTLGKVSNLTESAYHTPNTYVMVGRSNAGFNSQVAENNVVAQVNVTFAIKTEK
jgi:uncharacterized protein YggE